MRKLALVLTILALPSSALFFFSQLSRPATEPPIARLRTPAAEGSGQPNLHTSDAGEVYMSWIEPGPAEGYLLRFSKWTSKGWTDPSTVASGERWFVNWADFPALAVADGFMGAHFLALNGPRSYDYDIRLTLSRDGGSTWSAPLTPHRDGVQAEHGFVSLLPWEERLGVVWLDGRHSASGHGSGAMTLRFATVDSQGEIQDEVELDDRVCDCCQTSAARTAEGLIVAYRDRSPEEIRDIGLVRLVNGQWTEPQIVHQDKWQIGGCPVNGPAVVAQDRDVAVAWYTQPEDLGRVNLAFSSDSGQTFGPPVAVDDGETMGRVDAVMLADRSVVVSWIEFVGEEGAEIRLRRVHPDGRQSPSAIITPTESSRKAGFPRLASLGDDLLVAWTQAAAETRVAAAKVRVLETLPLQ